MILAALVFAACEGLQIPGIGNYGTNEPGDKGPQSAILVSSTQLGFDADSHSYVVSVTANCSWNALPSQPWITVDPQSGEAQKNPIDVTIMISANTGEERDGIISIQSTDGSDFVEITVHQKSAQNSDNQNPDVKSFVYAEGDVIGSKIYDANEIQVMMATTASVDKDWNLTEPGTMIILDMLCKKGSGTTVPDGTYVINDSDAENTIVPAVIVNVEEYINYMIAMYATLGMGEYTYEEMAEELGCDGMAKEDMFIYSGSAVYVYDSNLNVEGYGIVSGSVTVSGSGSKYTFTGEVIDENGTTWNFSYSGNININEQQDDDDDNDDDVISVNFTDLVYADCNNYGDYFECGANDWYFEVYNEEEYGVCFDILSSSNTIPTGTFTLSDSYKAGVALVGSFDEDDYTCGAWYFDPEYYIAPCDNGTISISKNGSEYTITFDLTCSEYDTYYKGTFTGTITDYTDAYSAAYLPAAKTLAPRGVNKNAKINQLINNYGRHQLHRRSI